MRSLNFLFGDLSETQSSLIMLGVGVLFGIGLSILILKFIFRVQLRKSKWWVVPVLASAIGCAVTWSALFVFNIWNYEFLRPLFNSLIFRVIIDTYPYFGVLIFPVLFSLFGTALLIPLYIIYFKHQKKIFFFRSSISNVRAGWLFWLVTTFFLPILYTALFFIFIFALDRCSGEPLYVFHEFNAHLKDVCSPSKNAAECPKNESELIAFNHDRFKVLHECAKTSYTYNSSTQQYTWIVRFPGNEVLVADPHFTETGFGQFFLKSGSSGAVDPQYSYPPQFPGPWNTLPQ
jgi:hypothetical protein